MSLHRIKRRNARVPLVVGETWVYLGPGTEYTITALRPRPTFQKPWSQAVTLSDGRTITEASLRYAYQRKQEYVERMVWLRGQWELAKAEFFGLAPSTAQVIPFPERRRGRRAA